MQIKTTVQGLQPLFDKAVKEGLWFHCVYQDLWFSPSELHEQQQAGRFRWGAVNWKLRNPIERLDQLERKHRESQEEIDTFRRRIAELT